MKIIITGKNFNASSYLQETIEKKFEKLGKYFSDDISTSVRLSQERGKDKVEATINANGTMFRAEEAADDVYEAVDSIIDKLSNQMSKYKGKLRKRYNDNKTVRLEFVPEAEQEIDDIKVVRTKKFELRPMDVEEAIMQMELLGHNFFVFMDMETDSVNVVYKRKDKDYGILETIY